MQYREFSFGALENLPDKVPSKTVAAAKVEPRSVRKIVASLCKFNGIRLSDFGREEHAVKIAADTVLDAVKEALAGQELHLFLTEVCGSGDNGSATLKEFTDVIISR